MDSMFDTMLQLPLFQGLAQEDFTNILAKVKLHFVRHKKGEVLAREGDPCDRLVFVLQGAVNVATPAADRVYLFSERCEAPLLVEPYSLFGMTTAYVSTYTALDNATSTVSISKSFVLDELARYEIFRLNYTNILCNRAQILQRRLWHVNGGDLKERIVRFIASRAERPAGPKTLKIKMEDLARIVNDTRLNVSKVLNALQDKDLLELRRGEITVHRLEDLLGRHPQA